MRLREVLNVLSKSSSYAVSTENKYTDLTNQLDQIKKDLYVVMPIEHRVNEVIQLLNAAPKQVFFLCGSSGDGKSELLVQAKAKAKPHVRFHLDATHSFDPHEDAIETLDQLFDEFEAGDFSLVVGINIGMLGNYEQGGQNLRFKEAIKQYQANKTQAPGFTFVSFEDYPKFEITKQGYQANFAQKILAKVTSPSSLLFKLAEQESQLPQDDESLQIQTNYKLLCIPAIQEVVVELLFKARLVREQFLTARGLLDLINQLLTGPGYLFDNLFAGGDNELAGKLVDFDPALLRTKAIDRFLMSSELKLKDADFEQFCQEIEGKFGLTKLPNPKSYIRLFYLLKNCDLESNFQQQFQHDFEERLLQDYLDVYRLHAFYEDTPACRERIKAFYNKQLFSALRHYINRNAPQLSTKQFLVSQFDGCQIAAQLDLKADITALKNEAIRSPNTFTARIKVGDTALAFAVNINLFELIERINSGYRPSKNDRSSVILLNDTAEKISLIARESNDLFISSATANYKFSLDDDFIEAEEL